MNILLEIADQLLHTLWAFAPIVVFWLILQRPKWPWRAIIAGAVAALVFALPREIVDQWPIERPLDTLLDLAFFVTGGAFAGILGWKAH